MLSLILQPNFRSLQTCLKQRGFQDHHRAFDFEERGFLLLTSQPDSILETCSFSAAHLNHFDFYLQLSSEPLCFWKCLCNTRVRLISCCLCRLWLWGQRLRPFNQTVVNKAKTTVHENLLVTCMTRLVSNHLWINQEVSKRWTFAPDADLFPTNPCSAQPLKTVFSLLMKKKLFFS